MIFNRHVRALAAGLLLTLTVASIGLPFFPVEAHSVESVQSIAQGLPLAAQAPIVRDHRTPRPAVGTAVPAQQPTQITLAAQTPIVRDHRQPLPLARLSLVMHKIIIHDDRDWGSGDISVNVVVSSRDLACREHGCGTRLVDVTLPEFLANSGDEHRFGARIVPAPFESVADAAYIPGYGIPIYANQEYSFEIRAVDKDPVIDDELGSVVRRINAQNGWGPPATYTERGQIGGKAGHFSVEYEIRQTFLPDLEPTGIEVRRPAGSTDDEVCVNIVNRGNRDAGPFQVAFGLEGGTAPARLGERITYSLASGQHTALCLRTKLPTTGLYDLTAVVDDQQRVIEGNETNNTIRQAHTPSGLTAGQAVGNAEPSPSRTSTPTPASSAASRPTRTPTPLPTVRPAVVQP